MGRVAYEVSAHCRKKRQKKNKGNGGVYKGTTTIRSILARHREFKKSGKPYKRTASEDAYFTRGDDRRKAEFAAFKRKYGEYRQSKRKKPHRTRAPKIKKLETKQDSVFVDQPPSPGFNFTAAPDSPKPERKRAVPLSFSPRTTRAGAKRRGGAATTRSIHNLLTAREKAIAAGKGFERFAPDPDALLQKNKKKKKKKKGTAASARAYARGAITKKRNRKRAKRTRKEQYEDDELIARRNREARQRRAERGRKTPVKRFRFRRGRKAQQFPEIPVDVKKATLDAFIQLLGP